MASFTGGPQGPSRNQEKGHPMIMLAVVETRT